MISKNKKAPAVSEIVGIVVWWVLMIPATLFVVREIIAHPKDGQVLVLGLLIVTFAITCVSALVTGFLKLFEKK